MVDSSEAVAMVETIFELGRQMKLEIVAEGVEEKQQLDILQRIHCVSAQGYLFSRPVEADAMTELLIELPPSGPERFPKARSPRPGDSTIPAFHLASR
jgi:EAL domain-containing protein (putative c-di-GMP-specific phosphodiesterase class I)